MYAILDTGGKQYKVKAGDIFQIEKLNLEKDSEIEFTSVLFLSSYESIETHSTPNKKEKPANKETAQKETVILKSERPKKIFIGHPYVEGAKIKAKILNEEKGRKILVFKKKRRKGYRRTQGHRQKYTKVFVQSIQTPEGEIFTPSPIVALKSKTSFSSEKKTTKTSSKESEKIEKTLKNKNINQKKEN